MASSWSSYDQFCCAQQTGHRKWQRRREVRGFRISELEDNVEVAPSELSAIELANVEAGSIFRHHKNHKSLSAKERKKLDEDLTVYLLWALLHDLLLQQTLPSFRQEFAPDVIAIRMREDNLIGCCCCLWSTYQLWPQANRTSQQSGSQTSTLTPKWPNIIFIGFNHHDNKLTGSSHLVAPIWPFLCFAQSGCHSDDSRVCDCWPVIVRLGPPGDFRSSSCCRLRRAEFLSAQLRFGEISGVPSDTVTNSHRFPQQNSDCNLFSLVADTTINLSPPTRIETSAPTSAKKEALIELKSIAPVCSLAALCLGGWQLISMVNRMGQQVNKDKKEPLLRSVVACNRSALHARCRKMKPNKSAGINKEMGTAISHWRLLSGGDRLNAATNILARVQMSNGNDCYDNGEIEDDYWPGRQQGAQESDLGQAIDWPKLQLTPMGLLSFSGSFSAPDEFGYRCGSCNPSGRDSSAWTKMKLEAKLLSCFNIRIDRPMQSEQNNMSTSLDSNKGPPRYCYQHHNYYHCDYYYCHRYTVQLSGNNRRKGWQSHSVKSADDTVDMLHYIRRLPIRTARWRISGPLVSASLRRLSVTNDELITDRVPNYWDATNIHPQLGAEMAKSELRKSPAGVGLQGCHLAGSKKARQVLLFQPKRFLNVAACFILCLVLVLCKFRQPTCATTASGHSGPPSNMAESTGSAGPAPSSPLDGGHNEALERCDDAAEGENRATQRTRGGPSWSGLPVVAAVATEHRRQLLAWSSLGLSANKTSNEQPVAALGQLNGFAASYNGGRPSKSQPEGRFERIQPSIYRGAPGSKKTPSFDDRTSKTRSGRLDRSAYIAAERYTLGAITGYSRSGWTGSHSGHERARNKEVTSDSFTEEPIGAKDRWGPRKADSDYYIGVIDKRAISDRSMSRKKFVVGRHHHHHHHGTNRDQQPHPLNPHRDQWEQQQHLCPSRCQCVWKNGKQFADCSRLGLANIPAGFDPLLQVLNLSSNPLHHLTGSAFNSLNLNNLQRIFLSGCQLRTIDQAAFENLKLVVELDFSWNRLQFVPLAQIGRMSLLRKLSMRGNPLNLLTEATFAPPSDSAADKAVNLASQPDGDSLSSNMSRLYESYPSLARSLLLSHKRISVKASNFMVAEDESFIIERMELQLLESIVHQHEEIGLEGDLEDERLDDNDNVDGPIGRLAANQDHKLAANELPRRKKRSLASMDTEASGLGGHFSQLQELDFGQCQLTYIKWSVFDQLKQLKRLHLDGNRLSQLSGKLVETLPVALHQLSLEGNPWICDCRFLALKRWLQSTRTPLSAPVKCSQFVTSPNSTADYETPDQRMSNSILSLPLANNNRSRSTGRQTNNNNRELEQYEGQSSAYLDQLEVENFICLPQANSCSAQSSALNNRSLLIAKPNLSSILGYLEPTLINSGLNSTANNTPASARMMTKSLEANEGDRVDLSCSFLAYPAWSVRVLWMADFSRTTDQVPQSRPGTDKSATNLSQVLLYDSRFDDTENSTSSSNGDKQFGSKKTTSRIRFDQSEWSNPRGHNLSSVLGIKAPDESMSLDTRLSIESVTVADTARYKCLVANRAGQASLEILVRVSANPLELSGSVPSSHNDGHINGDEKPSNPVGSDQRSWQDQMNKLRAEQSSQAASSSQVTSTVRQQEQQPRQSSGTVWLRSSTTFQVTIAIVSVMMAAVTIAFILFCIIIYQIKPSARCTMVNYLASPGLTGGPKQVIGRDLGVHAGTNGSLIINGGASMYASGFPANGAATPLLATSIGSDAITGRTPVRFIAHPILQSAQFVGSTRQPINNRTTMVATSLSQQEQESIRLVENWNTTQTTSPDSSGQQSTENWQGYQNYPATYDL